MKLGKAFSDNLESVGKRNRSLIREDNHAWWLGSGRVLIFTVLLVVAFFALSVRLIDLTLVQGFNYRVLAESNRTKELVRHAPRGILRDRSGQPLVDNIIQYRLLRPCSAGEKPQNGTCVSSLTKAEGDMMLAAGLPMGTFLETDYQRSYRNGESIAHVVGYTGEVSQVELDNEYYSLRGYKLGDKIGRMGAESIFEDRLRGRDGKELVEVDADGRMIRMLGRDNEIPGSDVTLSIDADLSKAVQKAFPAGFKGAVVVSKPSTGEILAMYSSPTFDPNSFSAGMSSQAYDQLIKDKSLPMFNRAIGGVYPPGSTYKLVTAVAGLQEGIIKPNTLIEDTGIIKVGPFSFSNWYYTQYGKTEGLVNITKAIARSNDIYFYKLGEKIGIETLAKWSRIMGIGSRTGIELPGEETGLMPDPEWKNAQFTSAADLKARNNLWYDGDTYHVSIGQGYLLTTPLQVNHWTDIVATGQTCRPTIEKVGKGHPADCQDLNLKPLVRDNIIEGMTEACSTGGTAYPMFDFGIKDSSANANSSTPADKSASPAAEGRKQVAVTRIPVACKTGTAEISDQNKETHAWFTVFAPVPEKYADRANTVPGQKDMISGDPEISVTVLVEEGGEGSTVAAPIAKAILSEWFSR